MAARLRVASGVGAIVERGGNATGKSRAGMGPKALYPCSAMYPGEELVTAPWLGGAWFRADGMWRYGATELTSAGEQRHAGLILHKWAHVLVRYRGHSHSGGWHLGDAIGLWDRGGDWRWAGVTASVETCRACGGLQVR